MELNTLTRMKGKNKIMKNLYTLKEKSQNNIKPNNEIKLRQVSLDWFFLKSNTEKEELKNKHFKGKHIQQSSHWGYHFTFGQIEEMYLKEHK